MSAKHTPDTRTSAVRHFADLYEGGWASDAAATLRALAAERDELLEALRKAEQQLDYGQYDAAQDIIRAAIAKATGGAA